MFGRKKKEIHAYDRETLQPMIRCSICTGEKTAGFREKKTGRFKEMMLIRSDRDLKEFRRQYGIPEGEEIRTEY